MRFLSILLLLMSTNLQAKIKYMNVSGDASGQFNLEMQRYLVLDERDEVATWISPSATINMYLAGNQKFNVMLGAQVLYGAKDTLNHRRLDFVQISPTVGIEYRVSSYWYPQIVFHGTRGSGELDQLKIEDRGAKMEWRNIIPVTDRFSFSLNIGGSRMKRYYFKEHKEINYYQAPTESLKTYTYASAGIVAEVN